MAKTEPATDVQKEYKIDIDKEYTIWGRQTFTVTASSEEEAIELIREFDRTGDCDDRLDEGYFEYLFETIEDTDKEPEYCIEDGFFKPLYKND